MIAYGWTYDEIIEACKATNLKIGHGSIFYPNNFNILTKNCRRGGWTTQFSLRLRSSTSRKKDGSYPPCVLVRYSIKLKVEKILDPVPFCELTKMLFPVDRFRYKDESTTFRRSAGVPCWHGHGHFYREMFKLRPEGRIRTAKANYNGLTLFERLYPKTNKNIGSLAKPLRYSDACDCSLYNKEKF